MKFATADLGTVLRPELDSAAAGTISVAYFNPDDATLSALAKLPALRLVISEAFQINDPDKLELLAPICTMRRTSESVLRIAVTANSPRGSEWRMWDLEDCPGSDLCQCLISRHFTSIRGLLLR